MARPHLPACPDDETGSATRPAETTVHQGRATAHDLGLSHAGSTRTLDSHACRLRHKLAGRRPLRGQRVGPMPFAIRSATRSCARVEALLRRADARRRPGRLRVKGPGGTDNLSGFEALPYSPRYMRTANAAIDTTAMAKPGARGDGAGRHRRPR
jgi:hypothetical protein